MELYSYSEKAKMSPMEKAKDFYDSFGWDEEGGNTQDANLWEDLRPSAKNYVSKCRRRVLKYIPESGKYMLDAASGPIQFSEYLEYSENCEKRYCVDISKKALEKAKMKIQEHGEYFNCDLINLPFKDDVFDCAISLHTIYHIDKTQQEKAVRELIRVIKPNQNVIIVYANSLRPLSVLLKPFILLIKIY
ncbi:MAG: class I SAM-dependent methyltransferase [Deltaproteobacteria bacterium]|nr:class I SAM-dependent methyltransferase [Deltaproteobacteria bacterium]